VSRIHRADSGLDDVDLVDRAKPFSQERGLELSCDAEKYAHKRISKILPPVRSGDVAKNAITARSVPAAAD
jgi:hypothetical protein